MIFTAVSIFLTWLTFGTDVTKLLAFEASDNLYPILHENYCFMIDRVDEKPLMQSFSKIVFRFQHNFNCPKFCRVSLYETRCFRVFELSL